MQDVYTLSHAVYFSHRCLNVAGYDHVPRVSAAGVAVHARALWRLDEYAAHARSTPELAQADSDFSQQHGAGSRVLGAVCCACSVTAAAGAALPISLRALAADARDVVFQERLLCERLQQLLGIRNESWPNDREVCRLTLHCKSVDSVQGHPFFESRHLTSSCSSFLPIA